MKKRNMHCVANTLDILPKEEAGMGALLRLEPKEILALVDRRAPDDFIIGMSH
jgi:hypothetical protein